MTLGKGARVTLAVLVFGAAVLAVTGVPNPAPPEGLCERGTILRTARLLNESEAAYGRAEGEGHKCGVTGRRQVARGLNVSIREISSANVFDASAEKWRSIPLYIHGLDLSPFEVGAATALKARLTAKNEVRSATTAIARCELASELTRAGLLADAGLMVAAGLERAPAPCKRVLGRLDRRRVRASVRLRRAALLSASGDAAGARVQYARALRADPTLGEARTGLEGTLDEGSPIDSLGDWLAGIPGALKSALAWLIPVLVALLLLSLAAWFGLRELARYSTRARTRLAAWGEHRFLSPLRNAALPRVSVADFDGGSDAGAEGKDFSALLVTMLPKQAGREPPFPFDRLSKGSGEDRAAATAIASVLEEVPQAKLFGNLLKLWSGLYRRRSIVLSGRLVPVGDRGAGVTLSLEGSGTEDESGITLWERAFDPKPGGEGAARWLRLVPAATVWARWQMSAAYAQDGRKWNPDRWLPDALFQAGVAWQALGELDRAAFLYAEVIELDPKHLSAAYNLAMTEIDKGKYVLARERLLALLKSLEESRKLARKWPKLKTACLYPLALAYAYSAPPEA